MWDLYENPERAREAGFWFDGVPTCQVLQALLHVDDCLVFSKLLCTSCLVAGLSTVWPADVGLTVESTEQTVDFLRVTVTFATGHEEPELFSVAPSFPDSEFVLGRSIELPEAV